MNTRKIGNKKEELARKLLTLNDYEIIESNFRCKKGEIDIIGRNEGYLCFIEVKYRSTNYKGVAAEAVTPQKQIIYSEVFDIYRLSRKINPQTPIRFDVVAIQGKQYKIIKNAFSYHSRRHLT